MSIPDNRPIVEDLWVDAHLAAMTGDKPYGTIRDGALAVAGGRIIWVGEKANCPLNLRPGPKGFTRPGEDGSRRAWSIVIPIWSMEDIGPGSLNCGFKGPLTKK